MRVREPIVALVLTFMIPWNARAQEVTQAAPPPAIEGTMHASAQSDSLNVSQEGAALPPPPIPVQATEPDFPRGRISGYMFGDAYYNVDGDPVHRYSTAGADSDHVYLDQVGSSLNSVGGPARNIGKDLNGVQLRRIYFQLDNDLSIQFATRLRFEMDSRELSSGGKIASWVKAAYLQVKNIVPRTNFFFGMTPTPTFENAEDFWQYRAIEKSIVDFRGLAPSADIGVLVKGFADGGHKIGYSAMLGNGNGQRPENNRYKRLYLGLPLNPIPDLKVEPYVDYEHGLNGADRALYKLFAGYEFKRLGIGGEIFRQVVHSRTAANAEAAGFSVFARMAPSPTLGGYARFDLFQPNKRVPNRVDTSLYIAGLDWQPYKDVHVMPNVEHAKYDAKGTATALANDDTQARLTFYYRFSKP